MTDVTIPGTYPRYHYGAHLIGTRFTACTDADLINPSANVLAMPNCPIVVLNAGLFTPADTFFGMSVQQRANDSVAGLTFKTVRSHDMENGKGRWQKIETTAGVFDWADMDSWVSAHYAAGRDIVFTLFGTPTYYSARPTEQGIYGPSNLGIQAEPSDMSKWDTFCTTVATRYLGKIKYYEVWNEPNMNNNGTTASGTSFFFSGTFAKLSEMVRRANQAIKAVDPTAKIICPAVQGWAASANASDTYFAGMVAASSGDGGLTPMKNWFDIVGVHLYPPSVNRVQDLPAIIDRLVALKATASISAMEVWDTESAPIGTGYEVTDLTDDKAWRLMLRHLVITAAKGIARTIYYQYDHGTMGFAGRTYLIRQREALIAELNSGISGASMFTDGRVVYASSQGQKVL